MEYENQNENKVGAGILIICILHFIGAVFLILALLAGQALMTPDLAAQYGISTESFAPLVISNVIIYLIYIIACILLLCKQKIGVFIYLFIVLTKIIMTIVLSGFSPISLLFSLILPVLMAVFISKKKELYGFGTK